MKRFIKFVYQKGNRKKRWHNYEKASMRLLNVTGLRVGMNGYGNVWVRYHAGIKDDFCPGTTSLRGVYGMGADFEAACEDYWAKISGKTLVFKPDPEHAWEVTIP
jgi:hypothetical protein